MKRFAITLITTFAALIPQAALAHTGHSEQSFASGVLHPLTGVDHVAAMLLVGIGAAMFVRRAGWLIPVTFMLALPAGFVTSTWLPGALGQAGILASLITLGLAAAFRVKVATPIALLVIALFGYAHGAAHGIEVPQGAAPLVFGAGFLAASTFLQLGGYWLARMLSVRSLQVFGVGSAGLGVVLAGLS
jgi:urease accessory protein